MRIKQTVDNSYKTNRGWSDQFIPQIKTIVGPLLLEESSFEVDTKQAADLVILRGQNTTLACRVRRPGYLDRYPDEFTIRNKSNGHKTEMHKIVDGYGDLMFYGHADPGGNIVKWWLLDLRAFRAHLLRHFARPEKSRVIRMGDEDNGDGTGFLWFDINSFLGEPPLVIEEGGNV